MTLSDPWAAPEATSAQVEPAPSGPAPRGVRVVAGLLIANLALSVLVTVLSAVDSDAVLHSYLSHHHLDRHDVLGVSTSFHRSVLVRLVGNLVLALVYSLLIRRLLRAQPRALRRVRRLAVLGIVGLTWLLGQPYPLAFHVEQGLQLVVLASVWWQLRQRDVAAWFGASIDAGPAASLGRASRAPQAWAAVGLVALLAGSVVLGRVSTPVPIPTQKAGVAAVRVDERPILVSRTSVRRVPTFPSAPKPAAGSTYLEVTATFTDADDRPVDLDAGLVELGWSTRDGASCAPARGLSVCLDSSRGAVVPALGTAPQLVVHLLPDQPVTVTKRFENASQHGFGADLDTDTLHLVVDSTGGTASLLLPPPA